MDFPSHAHFDAILGIDFLVRHKALIDVVELALPRAHQVQSRLETYGRFWTGLV